MEIDDIVRWFANTSDAPSRKEALNKILNVLHEEDFKYCFSIISKVKKARKDAANQPVEAEVGLSVRSSSVQPPLAEAGWLNRFNRSQVVALDVEKVQVPAAFPTSKKKYDQKAATISVVNYEGIEIFKTKIRREFGSYVVNQHTVKINGITATTLQEKDAEKPRDAYNRLASILNGKLVIGLELFNDFASFDDISYGLYDTFDLQQYYYRLSHSSRGRRIEEGLGLRSLVKHFFNTDMQPAGKVHTPEEDAKWTMKVFMDIYCNLKPPPDCKNENQEGTNYIVHYN